MKNDLIFSKSNIESMTKFLESMGMYEVAKKFRLIGRYKREELKRGKK